MTPEDRARQGIDELLAAAGWVLTLEDDSSLRRQLVQLPAFDRVPAAGALRQSVLKAAFTGRLVPHDPHDEPASELPQRVKERAQ